MEETPTVAILTLALLTAPALAGGVAASIDGAGSSSGTQADAWYQSGRLDHGDPHVDTSGSQTDFGAEVAVDGDWAVVAAPYEASIHVYGRVGSAWLSADVLEGTGGFGESLAVDEGTIAVGNPTDSSVAVFEHTQDGWKLASELTASETACMGSSVDVHGELLAAGDPCGSGTVHVYQRGQDGWTPGAELSVTRDADFPESLDLGAHHLLVGGDAMYAFHRSGDSWSQAELVSEAVGPQVATSQSLAATLSQGAILVFERDAGGWSQVAELEARDVSVFDNRYRFGWSLALDDGVLVAGAFDAAAGPGVANTEPLLPRECVSGGGFGACLPQRPGAVFVYGQDGTGWSQEAKLTPEAVTGERFGMAVDVDPDTGTLLAGAPGHPLGLAGFVDARDSAHIFTRALPGGLP
jgi:hypothetical protein